MLQANTPACLGDLSAKTKNMLSKLLLFNNVNILECMPSEVMIKWYWAHTMFEQYDIYLIIANPDQYKIW